jgi:hypothetical protein
MLFITKTYWRGLSSDAYGDIIDKQIIFTKTFDFNNNPFNENVLVCYFLVKNEEKHKETIFEFLQHSNKGIIINDMNIYFLYRDYFNYFKLLKEKYGSFEDVTRSTKTSGSNYLLIRHSTPEVLEQKNAPKDDKYYVIKDPNMLTKYFFTSKIYQDMRNIGIFTGFTTSKSIFNDIPNFNKITKTEKQDVLNKLKKNDSSLDKYKASTKIQAVTRGHQQREKTKKTKAIKTIDRILSKKIKKERNNKTVKIGGKNKKTRKQRSIFKLW